MPTVTEEYLIHMPTKRVILKSAKARPKGELKPYIPPKFLIKMRGTNEGVLFVWSYYLAQRKDMMPYDGPGVAGQTVDTRNMRGDIKPESPQVKTEPEAGELGLSADDSPRNAEEAFEKDDRLERVPTDEELYGDPKDKPMTQKDMPLGKLDIMAQEKGISRVEVIAGVIPRLAKEDYGRGGLPKMESLYRELDDTVAYPEMQEAWRLYKERTK